MRGSIAGRDPLLFPDAKPKKLFDSYLLLGLTAKDSTQSTVTGIDTNDSMSLCC